MILPICQLVLDKYVAVPFAVGLIHNCMQGSTTGYIRFETPEQAKLALDNTDDGKIVICDCPASVKFLEGEEERDFFAKVRRSINGQAPFVLFQGQPLAQAYIPAQYELSSPLHAV